jgi:hypothetical protein
LLPSLIRRLNPRDLTSVNVAVNGAGIVNTKTTTNMKKGKKVMRFTTTHRIGQATLPIIALTLAASIGPAKAETFFLTCRTHNLKSGVDETLKFEIDEQRFFIDGEPWPNQTVTIGMTAINTQSKFSTISVDVKIDRATGAYVETWTDAAKLEISTVRNGSCAKTDAPPQKF